MLTVKPPPIGLPRVFVATMVMGLVPLALLFVVWLGAAMAQSTHHHPFHYDFYRHWKQPGSTASCCFHASMTSRSVRYSPNWRISFSFRTRKVSDG